MTPNYDEGTIRTLDWQEHIRKRPGMYIGKLGDGSAADDGIYVLLKEVLDNSVDEFMIGFPACSGDGRRQVRSLQALSEYG